MASRDYSSIIHALAAHHREAGEISAQVREVARALEAVATAIEAGDIHGKYPVSADWMTNQLRPSRQFWKTVTYLTSLLPPINQGDID